MFSCHMHADVFFSFFFFQLAVLLLSYVSDDRAVGQWWKGRSTDWGVGLFKNASPFCSE